MANLEAAPAKAVESSQCSDPHRADLLSSDLGPDDPSEPPMTSYPSGGNVMQHPMVQYPPGVLMVPGMMPHTAPIVWDMGMMAMPMAMEAPWPLPEAWPPMSSIPATVKAHEASGTRSQNGRPGRARKIHHRAKSLNSRSSRQSVDDQPVQCAPELQECSLDLSEFPSLPQAKSLPERVPTAESLWPRPAPVVKASMCSVAVQCDLGIQCNSVGVASSEVAVQCEEASKSSSCSSAHACKYCGCVASAAAEVAGGTDEILAAASKDLARSLGTASAGSRLGENEKPATTSTPDVHAWGPANDWAWDRCNLDGDKSSEDAYSDEGEVLQRQDSLQRSLPPAPSGPAPLPPPKAKRTVKSCPDTPVSCSTKTPSSADSAAAASPAADDMSTGSERGIEVPHVDFMPPAQESLADRQQRDLARLRKRCREAERLEERLGHGLELNADQQMKAERLGPAEQLRAEILQLESRLASVTASEAPEWHGGTHPPEVFKEKKSKQRYRPPRCTKQRHDMRRAAMASASPVSSSGEEEMAVSDSDHSDGEFNLEPTTNEDNAHEAPPDMSQNFFPSHASTTSAPRRIPGHLGRRHFKGKDKRAAAASLQTSQGNLDQAGVSKKSVLRKSACAMTSKAWRVCIAVVLVALLLLVALRKLALLHQQGETSGKQQAADAVQEEEVPSLLPGASHAWAIEKPQDAPSRLQNKRVSTIMRNQDVEVARGEAAAKQIQDKVQQLRERGQQQRMARSYNRQRRKLERQGVQPEPDYITAWQQWQAQEMRRYQMLQYYAQTGQLSEEDAVQFQQMHYYQQFLQAQARAQAQGQALAQAQGYYQHYQPHSQRHGQLHGQPHGEPHGQPGWQKQKS